MRSVVVLLLLCGCFGHNDQVAVGIDNRTGQDHAFEVVVWWLEEGLEPVQRGNASGTVAAGEARALVTFERPCEEDLVGRVVYLGVLGNGTTTQWEQPWTADGCVEQHIALVLEQDRVRFTASYA